MAYGYQSYQPYAGLTPPAENTATVDESKSRNMLRDAINKLVRKSTQDGAEELAPQEGPAIGHMGGE